MSQAQAIAPEFSPEQVKELVNVLSEDFLASGRPIGALNAFCDCRDMGLPVHEAVMELLHKSFDEYRSKKGSVRLDKIMGLVPSRGRKPHYKEELLRRRNDELFENVARLYVLGFARSYEKAAEMVADQIKAIPIKEWVDKWPGLEKPNQHTILQKYYDWPKRKEVEKRYQRLPPSHTLIQHMRKRIISTFFPDNGRGHVR